MPGIASALVISEGAVERHVTNIFTKLDLPVSQAQHRRCARGAAVPPSRRTVRKDLRKTVLRQPGKFGSLDAASVLHRTRPLGTKAQARDKRVFTMRC